MPATLTPVVTSGSDGHNFGEKKCSPLLMEVTTFVLVACAKALRRVVVSFDVTVELEVRLWLQYAYDFMST